MLVTNPKDARRDGSNAPEVFSASEIARAAGVSAGLVQGLIAAGEIATIDGELVGETEAVAAVHGLAAGRWRPSGDGLSCDARPIFATVTRLRHTDGQSRGFSLALTSVLHVAVVLVAVALTTVRLTSSGPEDPKTLEPPKLVRLIFVAEPGPGGGGGGGGLRQPAPPPKAERKGTSRLSSPIPKRPAPKRIEIAPAPPPDPAPLDHKPLPPLVAPLAAAAADSRDRLGSLEQDAPESPVDSQGPGSGGGTGAGTGTGVGQGTGPGVGPGTGGGTGGGPYRPGSGIQPPRLLREVRPNYTEQARRAGLEGDVVLEIVVRHDGGVGDVRVVDRLGMGLDEEAIRAVRQWRFAPAQRLGRPVDVLVEIAVEFRLR